MSLISTKKIVLDFYNKNIVTINAKQHDTASRYINVACTDSGKKVRLDGKKATAFLRYTKNDGNIIFNQEDILDDGTILVELTEQTLAVVGKHELEIVLVSLADMSSEELDNIYAIYENGSTVISTMTFYLNVMPIMANVDSITSTEEYTSLSRALTSLTYLGQLTETLEDTQAANEASVIATENANKAYKDASDAAVAANEQTQLANEATERANSAAYECERVLDKGEVVYVEQKGAINGVAELDSNGFIYSKQINASSIVGGVVNHLSAKDNGAYQGALDARQGYVLNQKIVDLEEKIPSIIQEIHFNDVVDDSIGKDGDVLLVPLTTEEG